MVPTISAPRPTTTMGLWNEAMTAQTSIRVSSWLTRGTADSSRRAGITSPMVRPASLEAIRSAARSP